jgi:hypothetical protein
MRTRVTVAAVSGALALSALTVPAAQAEGAEPVQPAVSGVVINGGRTIVAGTGDVTFRVELTATHPSGIKAARLDLFRGWGSWLMTEPHAHYSPLDCTVQTPTASRCVGTITGHVMALDDPVGETAMNMLYSNTQAGDWNVRVEAYANDGSVYSNETYGKHKVLRESILTVNASPEPVRKGRTLTVTGQFIRSDWHEDAYVALAGQYVQLQFKKKDSANWSTLKTIRSNSEGALRTTTTATSDGSYRFSYAGATTTAASVSRWDHVDVQ